MTNENHAPIVGIELEELKDGASSEGNEVRIDLIKGLKVQVSVLVGQADISVEELFSLSKGSVVALDRSVEAPVDVLLDGKVIARGTLVAADDRFGVQIDEVEG